MNKKLTKTIILIVFVVFLGVTNVEAKTAKTCVYTYGDRINKISINDTYSNATIEDGSNAHGTIKNWSSGHKSGFSGYDYFVGNNNNCPPVLLQEKNTFVDDLWFSDDDNQEKVKKYIDDKVWVYKLTGQLDGEGAHGDTSNNNSATVITKKSCICSGNDSSKKISVTIDVSDKLEKPRTTIKFADDTNNESIKNWNDGYKDSDYTYMKDLATNNKCPDYAIISRSPHASSYLLLVSDSANLSHIQGEAKKFGNNWFGASPATVYTVGCTETVIENKTSNSNKPSEPPKEYDDPEINSNVTPLSPDFDTYSCGGSYLTGIPTRIIKLTKFIYIFLQVLVPIAIIILGSLDLLKAVAAQKEDEIKKGQQVFIKRLIGAAIVFFVFAIVKFIISLVSDNSTSIINCVDCFLKNNDSCVKE